MFREKSPIRSAESAEKIILKDDVCMGEDIDLYLRSKPLQVEIRNFGVGTVSVDRQYNPKTFSFEPMAVNFLLSAENMWYQDSDELGSVSILVVNQDGTTSYLEGELDIYECQPGEDYSKEKYNISFRYVLPRPSNSEAFKTPQPFRFVIESSEHVSEYSLRKFLPELFIDSDGQDIS